MNDIKLEVKRVSCPNVETNATVHELCEDIPIDGPIPMEDLIVLDGSLEGKRVRVLKDDGCNTNVVSHEFFRKHRKNFNWERC